MSSVKLPAGMPEAYGETHFRLAEHADEWPQEFAIITGYATTGEKWSHAEPGWAVALPFDTACEIGLRYRQDAIYFVSRDVLSVSYCDARRSLTEIGPFSPRVHVSAR